MESISWMIIKSIYNVQKLIEKVRNGEIKAVEELISHPQFNPQGFHEGLALVVAGACGWYKIVLLLLQKGVNPDSEDSNSVTAIYAAVGNNHVKVAGLLKEWGANPNKGWGATGNLRRALEDLLTRYELFIKKVSNLKIFWTFCNHERNLIIKKLPNGIKFLPVSLHPVSSEFFNAIGKKSILTEIQLDYMVKRLLPNLNNYNLNVGVFPDLEGTFWIIEPLHLQADLIK
ncbi:MAG: ankyrin repeat domain-containing protein [Desulfobacterales bacterium]|nr:ankyrin repeat domain-containing protein [Desulfobacterales bacterium]